MDILTENIEVNGKKYKLQHPGNRAVMKLQTSCINMQTGATDLEPLMDYCFEHVVIPTGHEFKPDLDNIHPKENEEWLAILPRFLRGDNLDEWKTAAKRVS